VAANSAALPGFCVSTGCRASREGSVLARFCRRWPWPLNPCLIKAWGLDAPRPCGDLRALAGYAARHWGVSATAAPSGIAPLLEAPPW